MESPKKEVSSHPVVVTSVQVYFVENNPILWQVNQGECSRNISCRNIEAQCPIQDLERK